MAESPEVRPLHAVSVGEYRQGGAAGLKGLHMIPDPALGNQTSEASVDPLSISWVVANLALGGHIPCPSVPVLDSVDYALSGDSRFVRFRASGH